MREEVLIMEGRLCRATYLRLGIALELARYSQHLGRFFLLR